MWSLRDFADIASQVIKLFFIYFPNKAHDKKYEKSIIIAVEQKYPEYCNTIRYMVRHSGGLFRLEKDEEDKFVLTIIFPLIHRYAKDLEKLKEVSQNVRSFKCLLIIDAGLSFEAELPQTIAMKNIVLRSVRD